MTSAAEPSDTGERRSALVMLHDFALDHRMWQPQVDALSSHFRVLTVDLPGFGAQSRNLGAVRPSEAIARAMDACGLVRANFLASGHGAAFAVDFALGAPRRVESLVLASPILLGRRMGVESWSRCAALANDGDLVTALETYLDDPLFASLRENEDMFEYVRQIVLDYGGAHWTQDVVNAFDEEDPASRLAEIHAPALVVSGERDIPSMRQMADAYVRALPRARQEIVVGAGHLPNLEAIGDFSRLVRSFLLGG